MPKGIPLTEHELLNRRRAIVNASVKLFLDQGFPETSMREIAEAAGVGKSSLYDYFKTKDDILLFLIEDMGVAIIEQAKAIAALAIPPDTRIRQIMHMQRSYLEDNDRLFWLLLNEAQRLKLESQQRIQERRYELQDLVRAMIEEGIVRGAFRPVNALLAARLMLNSLVPVLYTSRPTGSVEAMLDEAVDIFLKGIRI